MSTTVRAAVMKAPGRLEVERFPLPDPKPGAVLMRVSYPGIRLLLLPDHRSPERRRDLFGQRDGISGGLHEFFAGPDVHLDREPNLVQQFHPDLIRENLELTTTS